jgi:hypothetical protein
LDTANFDNDKFAEEEEWHDFEAVE